MFIVANANMSKETSGRHAATARVPAFAIAALVAGVAVASLTLSGGAGDKVASKEGSEPSVAEAYLNEAERPEPETSPQLPAGYQLATLSPEAAAGSLSLVKPEDWLPLETQYFSDVSSNVHSARYGNGNGEFIEVAYGLFDEKDTSILIGELNSSSTVSSVLPSEAPDSKADTPSASQNELLEKVQVKGEKTFSKRLIPETRVKSVGDPVVDAGKGIAEFGAALPIHSQYKVGEGEGRLFDFVHLLNKDGASYSVVIYRAANSEITEDDIDGIVRSLKVIPKA